MYRLRKNNNKNQKPKNKRKEKPPSVSMIEQRELFAFEQNPVGITRFD